MLRGDPQGHGQAVFGIGIGEGEMFGLDIDKANVGTPVGHFVVGKAEPVVGIVIPHRFLVVRSEIYDH